MKASACGVLVAVVFAFTGMAQTGGSTFEAVSVRPARVADGQDAQFSREEGGPGTADPGRISWSNISLGRLMTIAYGLKQPFELSAPDWTEKSRFDIAATLPASADVGQFQRMLQNLLAERFNVRTHYETRGIAGFDLVIAKGGAKLKEATPGLDQPPGSGAYQVDRNGLRELIPGRRNLVAFPLRDGRMRASGRLQSAADIAAMCVNIEGRPVIDKTGLTGQYDFNVDFLPPPGISANPRPYTGDGPAVEFAIAVQDELGLRLTTATVQTKVLVFDRGDSIPAGN